MNHVINVLLNMSHRLTDTPRPLNPPIAQRHLEAEVAHCVGGVSTPPWGDHVTDHDYVEAVATS
jgi:hypothetical protein